MLLLGQTVSTIITFCFSDVCCMCVICYFISPILDDKFESSLKIQTLCENKISFTSTVHHKLKCKGDLASAYDQVR